MVKTLFVCRNKRKNRHKGFQLDSNLIHEEYEAEIRSLNGNHEAYARKYGRHHSSYREEYVDFVNGKLEHASVCSRCSKRHENCRCNQRKDDWLVIG